MSEEEKNVEKEKIGKSFNYEDDIEDFGKKADEVQRRKLSKNETDAIFAVKQSLISAQIINKTKSDKLTATQKKLLEQELQKLKTSYEDNIENVELKDFDIFGGLSEDITKIKTIDNKKHREIEKDKYKVLNINKQRRILKRQRSVIPTVWTKQSILLSSLRVKT